MGTAMLMMIADIKNASNSVFVIGGIITGIGFLGGGVIFRSDNRVRGLTTAAEIWTMAIVGISIGSGLIYMAIVATIILLVILGPLKAIESKAERRTRRK
jgi:putative Mg2+ transporter-C (MgtC) family protein